MTTKILRAAIYARYSTTKQKKESIEDQYHECEKIAAREGLEVVARFNDKEISGGTTNRPGYQEMLDAARNDKFEFLLTEDISRLWRNRAEYGPRSAELEDLGINWLSCVGDDTRKDGWGMLVTIKQAIAEHERRQASYRTRRGLDGIARAGKNAGGKAFGYSSKAGLRTINTGEAKTVLQIYEWRAEGWSAQRIARSLNEMHVPSPGSSWVRKDEGIHRKTKSGWRPSAIAGDHRKGTGILNNPLYKGDTIWGRQKWVRSAADSAKRTPTDVAATEWIKRHDPALQIVPTELWQAVRKVQTATNPRREAVKRGITKKASGHDSRYFLGTILVCESCGANFIGNGLRDYVCPSHHSNDCTNDVRFRRTDAHEAVFDLLRTHMLSDEQIELGTRHVEDMLKLRVKQDMQAARDRVNGADIKRLDKEVAELRKLKLRPAALAAAVDEIEKERDALLAKAAGKQDPKGSRAQKLLAMVPEIVARYRNLIREGAKALASDNAIHAAREATRRLLMDGRITLRPTANHDGVTGPVHLVGLGQHVMELAGWQRKTRANHGVSPSGSGGRI